VAHLRHDAASKTGPISGAKPASNICRPPNEFFLCRKNGYRAEPLLRRDFAEATPTEASPQRIFSAVGALN
jgi:hypothetical protein